MKIESLFLFLSLGASIASLGYAAHPAADDTPSGSAALLQPDTSALKKRVSERWDALIAKDFAKAYEYFSPAYRKLFPLERYMGLTGNNVQWKSIDIKDISVDGDRADVEILLRYRVTLPPEAGFNMDDFGVMDQAIHEVWLREDGNWWYLNPSDGRL
jgi:hypothetical protein